MKNVSFKMGLLAVAIGGTFALSTSARTLDRKWGLNSSTGMYTDLTGKIQGTNYRCDASANTCTESYPSDVNPNDQANDQHPGVAEPTASTEGTFISL
ncbi:hypothetical protein [Mucilaginibacter agri]|uniref:Uncharacterized protein n=1 Tax=Mucilaginibacter agri TaxID=2695265 RepID=A0A965ZG76_9SPHI|nr:hypothetical protein [Mucilaginibacter agri]NCD69096.1 hypothetical protein [Mucilaginibacter agri]